METGVKSVALSTVLGILGNNALVYWANNLGLSGVKLSDYYKESGAEGARVHEYVEGVFSSGHFIKSDLLADPVSTTFEQWMSEHKVEIIGKEVSVKNGTLGVNCRLDLICRFDGVLSCVEIKTSKDIYFNNKLQAVAESELYNMDRDDADRIKQVFVLCVPRGSDGNFQVCDCSDLITGLWGLFKSVLGLYRSLKELGGA